MKLISLRYVPFFGVFAVGLLTFFFIKTKEINSAADEEFKSELRQLKQADADLNQEVLKTRFRLIAHYDGFSEQFLQIEKILERVKEIPSFVPEKDRELLLKAQKECAKALETKRELVENFKSQNSIVNNSLQYFPNAASELLNRLAVSNRSAGLESILGDLVREVLIYNLSPNEELAAPVQASVKQLRLWKNRNPGDEEELFVGTLILHVESILKRKPKVDELTSEILAIPGAQRAEQFHHLWEAAAAHALKARDTYRLLLYVSCILLVGGIAYTIFALAAANRVLDVRVKERTKDLSAKNEELEREVVERKRAQADLTQAQQEIVAKSRLAGMAEVATGVLHNVGNVLNSVNVSSNLLMDQIRKSRVLDLKKGLDLLREREGDLGVFLSSDPRGRKVPAFLFQAIEKVAQEHAAQVRELEAVQKNVAHIKEIVALQQSHAKHSALVEKINITELVDDTLRMNAEVFSLHRIELVKEYAEVPPLNTDRHKVLQILVNLVRNAAQACCESGRTDKKVVVQITGSDDFVRIAIIDNGVGIPAENIARIFNHGFTTKKEGHGFGLHSGANAAIELGGTLQAQSAGTGRGAIFELILPCENVGLERCLAA